ALDARRPPRGMASAHAGRDECRRPAARAPRSLDPRPRGLAHLRPGVPRPGGRRRGCAVVHDPVRTRLAHHLVDADLALGTLQTLARFQGRDVDARTEEEPGRILHEMRFGETASLALGGGRVYYGTVDATPLFVMLVGELSRWGSRREEVDALLPAADLALSWITDYGDRDGDGYVEYQRTTDRGLQNQGWKD